MKNKILLYSVMFVVFAFFVSGEIYVLNINSPSNNFYTNDQTPAFSFNIYGNTSTNNCTLYIDDLLYGTNESIINGTVVMTANDTLSEASHSWYINCSDEYGTNTTGTRTIIVDVANPTVTNVAVSDALIIESDSGKFYVNVDFSENMNSTILANITFQPSLLTSLNPCVSTWTNATHALYNCTIVDQNVTANNVNITVNLARDLASNVVTANISHSMFSIDQNGPTVSIDYPLDGAYYNVSSLYLNYTATGGVICWYKLDGSFTSLPGCADTTLSALTGGAHTLIVYVNDSVNNTISGTVDFNIDTTTPSVAISTAGNQLLGANAIPYLVAGTASGGNSSINTLKLFVNGVGSNILNISGNNWNKTWSPSAGTYNLTAEVCNLAATCVNSSVVSNITFDLTAPTTTNNADTANWSNLFAITLNPTDANGVVYTSYKVGSLVWQNGTTILINSSTNVSSGNILILYYSVDSIGNQENNKNVTVKYDITAPTSTITGFLDDYSPYTFNEWSSDTALVNLSGTDTHSGYNRTLYCTDTSDTCTPVAIWNVTLNITTPGITYIRYKSIDNINTAEVIRISRVMIIQNNTVYINGSLNVTENDTNIIVPEDSNNSNIYVPPNINATLDFSEIINISMNSTHNVTLNGSINTTINTTIIIVFEIPQNLTLSGDSSWLGNFNLPKLMPLTAATVDADSGYTATKDIVVEVGADDVPLLLDKAVRIKLTGKSAKLLGFYRDGFTKITATCVNDTQVWADANLSASVTGHCRITVGTDLIIWTKHLSKFVTYTQTEDDTGGNNNGGNNNNNGDSSDDTPYVPANQSNPSVTYSYLLLESGTRIINVTHSQIPLYGIALTTNANVTNARLKIILISNPPIAKAEMVYKYFQIDHESINDSKISGAKLQFKVAKSWLTENKIEKNQVALYRYINGWNALTTSVIKEDADNIYYEAASPGLSVFAIATKPKPPVTVVEPPSEIPATESSAETPPITDVIDQEVQGKTKNSNPIIVSIIVLIVIVVLLFSFYAKKNKKNIHK